MHRTPDAPDFFPSGAYLISADSHYTPPAFGVAVADSAAACDAALSAAGKALVVEPLGRTEGSAA
jgi:hypothetical protein